MISAAIACLMLLLPAVVWAGQSVPAHPEALVDGEWVVEHVEDSDVVVLDASDRKDDTYVKQTVEGALLLPYRELRQPSGLMKGVTYGMERETFDETPLEAMFRRAGIDGDTTVVVAAQYRVDDAMVLFWSLKWLGHDDVRLLPVNYLEALPEEALTSERQLVSEVDREGNFEARSDWSWYATREDVLRAMHSPATGLWDVRSKAYFEGDKTKTVRGGTLATAKNWPFKKAWTDEAMAELDWDVVAVNLKKRFAVQDRDRDATTVISFCNSGHTAAAGFLAWQCGFDWALCDPSWNMLAYDGSLPVKNIQFYVKP
jgi:thiosulfate/3-mercaptopyruvate sulfurtransferase